MNQSLSVFYFICKRKEKQNGLFTKKYSRAILKVEDTTLSKPAHFCTFVCVLCFGSFLISVCFLVFVLFFIFVLFCLFGYWPDKSPKLE